ncbi:MAG: DeoR family transcriptional regulator [Tannerella sp.]|nr:DeoR family transcriptional regulator [Tannerella sp.]
MKAVLYVKKNGRITNSEYQEINNVSKRTASNDLSELGEKYKIFKQLGASVGTYYEIT